MLVQPSAQDEYVPRYVHKHIYISKDMKNTETCQMSEIAGHHCSQTSQNVSSSMKKKGLHYTPPVIREANDACSNFVFCRKSM